MSDPRTRPPRDSIDSVGDGVRSQFDWTKTPPAIAIVRTVAVAADTDPMGVPPLYGAIDPESLESTLGLGVPSGDAGAIQVSFPYAGHEVTVERRGAVIVEPLPEVS